jgi:hypothetical protein
MFMQFSKLTNTAVSSLIIVNAEALLTIDFNNFENNGQIVNATHLEIGNPKYQFYTASTLASIEAALNVIDISAGFVPGPPCTGGTAATIIAPASSFPLLLVQTVHNYTLSETREQIVNPSKILYCETVNFIDNVTGRQVTGVQIVMNDTNRTRFLTTLSYSDIFSILQPVLVA